MMGEFGSAMLMMCCKTHLVLKPQPPVQHLQNLLKPMLLSVIHTFSLPPQLNPAHYHTQTQNQKRYHSVPVLSCVNQGAPKHHLTDSLNKYEMELEQCLLLTCSVTPYRSI